MDWTAIIALGAAAIAGLALLSKLLDKSLSIREHDEFRIGSRRDQEGIKSSLLRDIDRIERRLDQIERTRPTTSELQLSADSLRAQLVALEARLQNLK